MIELDRSILYRQCDNEDAFLRFPKHPGTHPKTAGPRPVHVQVQHRRDGGEKKNHRTSAIMRLPDDLLLLHEGKSISSHDRLPAYAESDRVLKSSITALSLTIVEPFLPWPDITTNTKILLYSGYSPTTSPHYIFQL